MLDQYSRNIDYIRISVTDRCNLRCIYCMPQTRKTYLRQEELLTYDEIDKTCWIYLQSRDQKCKADRGRTSGEGTCR